MAETVSVGCRVPNGLVLTIGRRTTPEGNIIDMGKSLPVAGPSRTMLTAEGSTIYCGHGITDIPKEFWDAWLKDNKDTALVKERYIFAQPKGESARAEAKELTGHNVGLEPYDPAKPAPGDAQIEKEFASKTPAFRQLVASA